MKLSMQHRKIKIYNLLITKNKLEKFDALRAFEHSRNALFKIESELSHNEKMNEQIVLVISNTINSDNGIDTFFWNECIDFSRELLNSIEELNKKKEFMIIQIDADEKRLLKCKSKEEYLEKKILTIKSEILTEANKMEMHETESLFAFYQGDFR